MLSNVKIDFKVSLLEDNGNEKYYLIFLREYYFFKYMPISRTRILDYAYTYGVSIANSTDSTANLSTILNGEPGFVKVSKNLMDFAYLSVKYKTLILKTLNGKKITNCGCSNLIGSPIMPQLFSDVSNVLTNPINDNNYFYDLTYSTLYTPLLYNSDLEVDTTYILDSGTDYELHQLTRAKERKFIYNLLTPDTILLGANPDNQEVYFMSNFKYINKAIFDSSNMDIITVESIDIVEGKALESVIPNNDILQDTVFKETTPYTLGSNVGFTKRAGVTTTSGYVFSDTYTITDTNVTSDAYTVIDPLGGPQVIISCAQTGGAYQVIVWPGINSATYFVTSCSGG